MLAEIMKIEQFSDKTLKYKFLLSSRSGLGIMRDTGSNDIILPMYPRYRLHRIGVLCRSDEYNLSLRTKADIRPPSLCEFYSALWITKEYQEFNIDRIFSNEDEPQTNYTYAVIENKDWRNPTGDINLDIYLTPL